MNKEFATGVLGSILSSMNKDNLAKTRNRMLIAAKISDALRNKGLTQKDFARMMGKTESEVSEWLSGDRNFTIDTLTAIELALKIKLLDTTLSKYSFTQQLKPNVAMMPHSFGRATRYQLRYRQNDDFSKTCVNF